MLPVKRVVCQNWTLTSYPMEEISKREVWIDNAKALLIFLMVLGHTPGTDGIPREVIYAFHMPAFFLISGYLYKNHSWEQTFISFFIPVLFFSFLQLCYEEVIHLVKGDLSFLEVLGKIPPPFIMINRGEYISLFTGFWFIFTLFCCRLMLGDIKWLRGIRKYGMFVSLTFITYMCFEPYIMKYQSIQDLNVYRVIPCFPFMMLGIKLKEWNIVKYLSCISCKTLFLLLLIYIPMAHFNATPDIFLNEYGFSYITFFPIALIGSLLSFAFCMKFRSNKIIVAFSKGTLLILGIHRIIVTIGGKVVSLFVDDTNPFWSSVLLALIAMLLCYPLILWCDKQHPELLGKNKR